MSANKHQILDAVQFEPLSLGSAGPSAYQNARELRVVIKPTRLNYAANPNFESGITGVTGFNSATVAQDSLCWRGTSSCVVTVPSAGTLNGGSHWTLNGLIPGRRYTASVRVAVAQGCGDVIPYASNNATLVNRVSFRSAKPDPSNKRWRTVWVTFDVSASTTTLGLFVDRTTMAAGQSSIFWFDGVLVEEGAAVRPYFDGSMGADYLWEASGTANLTRSYYYENYTERSYLIRTLLDENTPLGITSAVPQYAVLPTQ